VVALGAALVPLGMAVSAVRGPAIAPALLRTARGRVERSGGRLGWPARWRPALAGPVAGPGPLPCPLVLACVCHPGCTPARCGPGPGLPGPARIAAWCGAARAGCVRAPGPLAYTSCNSRMGNPNVAERLVLGERTVCEVGAVAITEGDRTSGAAALSFRADRIWRG